MGRASGRLVVALGVALLAAALAAYLLLHTQPAEQLGVNNTYAAIAPTDGKVEVVVYRNGHLDVLGTYNGIEFHNGNVPPYDNPLVIIQQLQQFDQQVVPQHPDYQYLNWTLILYSPTGHITLPITNNGYIDLSNINPDDIAAVATTNQYLIPLVKAILSQQGKLYIISANGAQYLYYHYPNIEEIDRETMDLQAYPGSYWGGGDLIIYNNTLIPIANTPTPIPPLKPVGAYNGSS